MQRALLNLAQNAAQAAPDQGGRVRLGARAEGDTLIFEVEDNGPGVPEDKRELVFAPFFTTKQKGTGLGLALVKRCVEHHRGTVAVAEAPGGGARFQVRLPGAVRAR